MGSVRISVYHEKETVETVSSYLFDIEASADIDDDVRGVGEVSADIEGVRQGYQNGLVL